MEIGGYFNLELGRGEGTGLGSNCLWLNSGRHALEYIVRSMPGIKKIHIPYFTCDVVLEPINRLQIPYQFYTINQDLEIDWTTLEIGKDELLIYNNYFGIKDAYIHGTLSEYNHPIIIDNAQALYAQPGSFFPSFYSPRKFVGIPDGGWVYLPQKLENKELFRSLEYDVSWNRCSHLLKRLELEAKEGYQDFKENSLKLKGQPIKKMSFLTQKIIDSIDFAAIGEKRLENFNVLDKELRPHNSLKIDLSQGAVPMVYPLLIEGDKRKNLIDNKIFVATYWPNVFEWCQSGQFEHYLSQHLLPLPIDQRYGLEEMKQILRVLNLN